MWAPRLTRLLRVYSFDITQYRVWGEAFAQLGVRVQHM
jgi:hypothetical protein